MWRCFLPHPYIVACENIFTQIHHRRAFAHPSSIAHPEAVYKIGVTVMHACAHAAQEALINRSESPFGRCMALAHSALASRENKLPKSEVATSGSDAIFSVQRHEDTEHVRYFEAFANENAHVTIQSLHKVAGREPKPIELVASLPLCFEVALANAQGELQRKHGQHFDILPSSIPPALDTRIPESADAIAPAGLQKLVDQALYVRTAFGRYVEHEHQ
mmetsp:Transcript_34030/g.98839  ORF Transcript_34030/g.98839 Transcript_34030/m.98839 type:complete len:218 (+) Transcript_34030:1746-2399(+)